MVSFSHLQQRQQVYRPYRPYPGKQPQRYHQNLHSTSTSPVFKMHSWARPSGPGPSIKVFMLVAVVLSLVLCFTAAAPRSAAQSPETGAARQSVGLVARPASWAAAFTSFAARAPGVAAGDSEVTDGSVFEIAVKAPPAEKLFGPAVTAAPAEQLFGTAVTAAPAEQTPPAQTVPSNVAGALIYALTDADKEQAAHALGGGQAALQELPAQSAKVELPPNDPSCKNCGCDYLAAVSAQLSVYEAGYRAWYVNGQCAQRWYYRSRAYHRE